MTTTSQHCPLRFIEINGARLAYRIIGAEDVPLLITLHGGRGFGKSSWIDVVLILRQVVTIPTSTHGRPCPTRFECFHSTFEDMDNLARLRHTPLPRLSMTSMACDSILLGINPP